MSQNSPPDTTGRLVGIIAQDPGVSALSRLHVAICLVFPLLISRYIPWVPRKTMGDFREASNFDRWLSLKLNRFTGNLVGGSPRSLSPSPDNEMELIARNNKQVRYVGVLILFGFVFMFDPTFSD